MRVNKKSILLIIGVVGIIALSLAIIDLRKRYELPFEREVLESFSIYYVSSDVETDILTFNKPEECEMIIDFFDSLEPSGRNLSGDGVASACAIKFHLKDGTEEKVTILEIGGKYTFEDGKDEYMFMRSKMNLHDMFPEETSIKILVDGTMYYWDKKAHPPGDYKEYGSILETIDGTPYKDCQMMTRYEVTGTIYTSELTPDAIYISMSIDNAVDFYVRFVTDELAAGPRILWNGISYSSNMYDGLNEVLKELPDTCEHIGNLHVISEDAIPKNDLEINCSTDSYGHSLEGQEVYFNSTDSDYIYVYQKRTGQEGEYYAYIKFPLLQ